MNLKSESLGDISVAIILFFFGLLWISISCVIIFEPRFFYLFMLTTPDYVFAVGSSFVSYLLFYHSFSILFKLFKLK